jgi:radical SAM protein with 4Fe4S-binding SPASM domain
MFGDKKIKLNNSMAKTIDAVYLKITNKCNLNCIYCYQQFDSKSCKDGDIRYYDKILKDYISEDNIYKFIFGGEPLLDSCIMNLEHLFTNTQDKMIIFTNGCFSERIRILLLNNVEKIKHLIITIDGPEDIHNMRRKSIYGNTYNMVIENLKYLINNKIPFAIQINIDCDNVGFVSTLIDRLFISFGSSILTITLNKVLHTEKSITELELLKLYVNLVHKYPQLSINVNSSVYRNLSSIITNNGFIGNRCGVGKTLIFDFSNSSIYTCPESSNSIIGTFTQTEVMINNNEVNRYIQYTNKDIEKCSSCSFKNYCKFGCIIDCDLDNKNCKDETNEELKYIFEHFNSFFNFE